MQSHPTLRIFDRATAIITGGASGIGRALAEELARRGCEVVLADRQFELAEKVASNIKGSGGKAVAVKTDVTDFSAMEQLIGETVKRTGRLDYIFNNAGIGIGGDINHYGIADWNDIIDVNIRGVINGIQAACRIMLEQGFGHIINTASMAGLMPTPGSTAYATTKHAVVGLSKSLRAEVASAGVRVSVLCPGVVRTPILAGGGKYGRIVGNVPPESIRRMWEKLRPMPPDLFAKKVLDAVKKNKSIIIVPSWWKLLWWLHRLFPSFGMFLAQKTFENMKKEFGIAG